MTPERAEAYGRVMKALSDIGPTKLHEDEQQVIREAADALVLEDDSAATTPATTALADARELIERLIDSDRMLPETARRLESDLLSCGHASPLAA